MFQYQNVPLQQQNDSRHVNEVLEIQAPALNRSPLRKFSTIILAGLFAILGMSMFMVVFIGGVHSPHVPAIKPFAAVDLEASEAPFLGSSTLKSTFCKTTCSSPCSKFPSVYGELCCEWSHSSTVGTTCALSVSPAGVCSCGIPQDADASAPNIPISVPVDAPTPSLQVVPVPKVLPPPTPHPSSVPQQSNNGGFQPWPTIGFHPWPTIGFHPWPTMEWIPMHPFPTMAWLPFNPIKVPEHATPCKRHCENPCGTANDNGEYYCCEPSPHGCGMTNINGQCWCG